MATDSKKSSSSSKEQDLSPRSETTGSSAQAQTGGGTPSARESEAHSGSEGGTGEQRVHPMQGKSLDYVRGPGYEAYVDGQYDSDAVNKEAHFNR